MKKKRTCRRSLELRTNANLHPPPHTRGPLPLTRTPHKNWHPAQPPLACPRGYLRGTSNPHHSLAHPLIPETVIRKPPYSPSGIPSSPSISRRQLSASTSAYLTLSCAQSWLHRATWYCDAWKYRSSSRMHSLTKTERLCCRTMLSLSCFCQQLFWGWGSVV